MTWTSNLAHLRCYLKLPPRDTVYRQEANTNLQLATQNPNVKAFLNLGLALVLPTIFKPARDATPESELL